MTSVHVLVGPDAGRGRAGSAHETVTEVLAAHGADVVDITGSDAAASRRAAATAVAEGAERLVVVGGDGLVHLGLQAVAGTETVLGVVPVGTGNDFVRGLESFPMEPAAAAQAALGDPTPLDAIHDGRHWIASVVTAGFSGGVNATANRLRFPRGPARYTVATIARLPGLRHRSLTLTIDGHRHEHDAAMVAVANTAWFGGGMQICPGADPADGSLEVTVVGAVGRVELLRFFRLVFDGRHLDHPKVHTHRGTRVEMETAGPDAGNMAVWGDGEPVTSTPTVLRAVPGALRLAGLGA